MALNINIDRLARAKPFQYIFVDSTTGAFAAGGEVTFWTSPAKIALKNIYIKTNDPINPFIQGANPQNLSTVGTLLQAVFLYPFDETDEDIEELYYVEAKNVNDVVIYSEQNIPINEASAATVDASIVNLAPSYGLDVRSSQNLFGPTPERNNIFLSNVATFPALGFIWVIQDPTNGNFYYTFTEIAEGTIPGNPTQFISLFQQDFGASQTNIFFGYPITFATECIGETITASLFIQDQSLVAVTSLNVGIIRSPAAEDDEETAGWSTVSPPINVGSITVTNALEKQEITFEMPALVTTPADSSLSYLVYSLPTSQNFQFNLTGFFSYEGENLTPVFFKRNLGDRLSRLFAQQMDNNLLSFKDYQSEYLPMGRGKGASIFQNRTGVIFEGPHNADFNFAVPMDGRNVIRGFPLLNTLGDRYLDAAGNLSTEAANSFSITNVTTTTFEIQTVRPASSYTPWVSNSTAISIVPTSTPTEVGVTAAIQSGPTQLETVVLTFDSNFLAEGVAANSVWRGFDIIDPATLPIAGSMINWMGTLTAINNHFLYLGWFSFDSTSPIIAATVAPGSVSSPAIYSIQFPAAGMTQAEIQTNFVRSDAAPGTKNVFLFENANWLGYLNQPTSPAGGPIPYRTPYVLQFHVDGDGADRASTVTTTTVNFTTAELASGISMANKVVATINNADAYELIYSGVPTNGESLEISSHNTNFTLIFHVTNAGRPNNPFPNRFPIFVPISPSSDIATAIQETIITLLNDIGGIPFPDDLGYTALNIPDSVQLYIEV